MENNRKAWLKWRAGGIGSSDAAAVHNCSPYSNAYKLWKEKTSIDEIVEKPMNWAMQKGADLEPRARAKFAALYNIQYEKEEKFEAANLEMLGTPYMRASLDGISLDRKLIVEFKYQGKEAHTNTANEELPLTSTNAEIACRVRQHYFIQVQHQLLVSGAEKAFFVSFDENSLAFLEILPDHSFFIKHALECGKFWSHVQWKIPPPIFEKPRKKRGKKNATSERTDGSGITL